MAKISCIVTVALTVVALACLASVVQGHTYKTGDCPTVEPMSGFSMKQFLGVWYVIQKTGTASTCVIYNITKSPDTPDEYFIEQISQKAPLSIAPIKHEYSYTGKLTVTDRDVPARMTVRFPLSVAGSAKFVVFMTDYDTYAGVFSCQKIPFGHRQSATLLSRTRDLDKIFVDKIRARLSSYAVDPFALSIVNQTGCPEPDEAGGWSIHIDPDTFSTRTIKNAFRKAGKAISDGVGTAIRARLSSYSVDPFDLSIVNQTGCPKEGEAGWNIHIDPDTFSTRNIANAFRKAGEAIGDGFEAAVNAGKKIYNKYREGDSEEVEGYVEETTNRSERLVKTEKVVGAVEWLP
uniref:Apolipoprotein D n=1 Tax=Anopheles farauti TaxID=69004 RepID=A0A182QI57_9DIPT